MNQQTDLKTAAARSGETEIDLVELFGFFRKNLIMIVVGFIAGAIIAWAATNFMMTPKYTATAKMYMVSSSTQSVVDLTDLNIGKSLSSDYVELLKTRPIIEGVIQDLKLPYTYGQVVGMLNLSVVSDTRIINIHVTSPDNREAMNIANALAEKGVKELPKLMETPEPHIAEYAIVPVNPSSPNKSRNMMMGALLGLIIMLAIFTVQFLTDDTFKSAEDIEKEFGVMPLTVIPEGQIEGFSDSSHKESSRKARKMSILTRKNKMQHEKVYGPRK